MNSCSVCGINASVQPSSNDQVVNCLECIDPSVANSTSPTIDDGKSYKCFVCLQSLGISQFRLEIGKSNNLGTCLDCGFKFGVCSSCQNYSSNANETLGKQWSLDLLKQGICCLDHHQNSQNNSFKLFDISNGISGEISKDLKSQMKSLYESFLGNLNVNLKIMKKRSVDEIMEMASKSRDDLFKQLDIPVDFLHRKRILVASFEQDLRDLKDGGSKRQARGLRKRMELSGFIIVEWHKKEGYTSLNNIVLKTLNSRLLLDLTLIGFKVCINQEKMESKKTIGLIRSWYRNYGDIDSTKLPIWMYTQIPLENKRFIGLVRMEHDPFFGKYLMSLGWSKKEPKIAVNDFTEWSISIEELENFYRLNASQDEWEIWSTKPISEYLEWRAKTRLTNNGILKYRAVPPSPESINNTKQEESFSKDSEISNQEFNEPVSKKPKNPKAPKISKPNQKHKKESPIMVHKKKIRHCRCCGSSNCPGRGGGKYCSCHKPNCTRFL